MAREYKDEYTIKGDIRYGDLYKPGGKVRKRREWRGLGIRFTITPIGSR